MPTIALLTDFGLQDTYVAQLHGVIAARDEALRVRVIDVTHAVPAQNILVGAYRLDDAVEAFAPGTIFVVVVDPGVGSARRAIAAEIGPWRFVGPDNGLLTMVCERFPLGTVVELTNAAFHRQPCSATFHGRDLFAPAAAAWAMGTPLRELGPVVTDPLTRIAHARPVRHQEGALLTISGTVVDADRYGNLRTNLRRSDIFQMNSAAQPEMTVALDGNDIGGLSRCYAEQVAGDVVALFGSNDRLEIAVCQGSAAERFPQAKTVTVTIPSL